MAGLKTGLPLNASQYSFKNRIVRSMFDLATSLFYSAYSISSLTSTAIGNMHLFSSNACVKVLHYLYSGYYGIKISKRKLPRKEHTTKITMWDRSNAYTSLSHSDLITDWTDSVRVGFLERNVGRYFRRSISKVLFSRISRNKLKQHAEAFYMHKPRVSTIKPARYPYPA